MYKLLFILFLLPCVVFAQDKSIGAPKVVNYSKAVYNGGTQNWNISQDSKGFMYFANNDGVLRFDGLHWELFEVPQSLVRAVYVDSNDRVFVAILSDFGLLEPDRSGKLEYKSLKSLIPEDEQSFNDVWKIHEIGDKIVFQSFEKIFVYDGENIEIIRPQNKFHFSFNVNNELYFQDLGLGLFRYNNGKPVKVAWAEQLKNDPVLSILKLKDGKLLVGTGDKGSYVFDGTMLKEWTTETNFFLKKHKLYSATQFSDELLAFGSILNGMLIADMDGNILQKISRSDELQNNTVLSIFFDKDRNIWMGLDNGISYAEINSPLSYITAQGALGTGYCAKLFENKLYLGTNQGLFVRSYPENENENDAKYSLIPDTEGQVWSLDVYNNELICGHNTGTYIIKNGRAQKISTIAGAWSFISVNGNPELLLGGHYSGMQVLKLVNGTWRFSHAVKGFDESSRTLFQETDGTVWMSHGGKGIFKIELNEKLDSVVSCSLYNEDKGLPSELQNILFRLNEKKYISTVKGVYQYNREEDRFEEANEINEFFGVKERILKVVTDNEKNVWYSAASETGVLRRNEDLSYTKISSPFDAIRDEFVSEFSFIYPFTPSQTLFGTDKGFALYNSKFPKSYGKSFKSFISKVELAYLDTVLYPSQSVGPVPEFPHRKNNIRFHYNAPFYENLKDLRFSYFLENYSEEWSVWSSDSYKDYTNLPFGAYTFKLKALNNYGTESEISQFSFSILPPWYQTRLANGLYVLSAVLLVLSIIIVTRRRIKQQAERARLLHEKELEEKDKRHKHEALVAEKEIVKLRNDKLRSEMIHRDKELANQTNGIIQKNKFLMKLKQELQKIQSNTDDGALKSKMVILKKRIDKEIDSEEQNRIFETYFDDAHKDFFERLKAKFPQLSPKDLRLCAYIKMNIPTKEIATLLNISYRGVEISRYRLRKKMELSREVNLSTFLAGI